MSTRDVNMLIIYVQMCTVKVTLALSLQNCERSNVKSFELLLSKTIELQHETLTKQTVDNASRQVTSINKHRETCHQ
jgi:hypothetical protein